VKNNGFKLRVMLNSVSEAMVKETKAKVLSRKSSFVKFQGIECTAFKIILQFFIPEPLPGGHYLTFPLN
jgi:hypothetical protein